MAQASLEELFPYVLPEVPAAPEQMVLQAASMAAIEFCKYTGVWHSEQNITPLEATPSYALAKPDASALLARVHLARYGSLPLYILSKEGLETLDPEWSGKQGAPSAVVPNLDGSITLYMEPNAAVAALSTKVRITAVWQPIAGTLTLEDTILDRYYDGLALGTKVRLFSQVGQPWSVDAPLEHALWRKFLRETRIVSATGLTLDMSYMQGPKLA